MTIKYFFIGAVFKTEEQMLEAQNVLMSLQLTRYMLMLCCFSNLYQMVNLLTCRLLNSWL